MDHWRSANRFEKMDVYYHYFEWMSQAEQEQHLPEDGILEGLPSQELRRESDEATGFSVYSFAKWLEFGRHDCTFADALV